MGDVSGWGQGRPKRRIRAGRERDKPADQKRRAARPKDTDRAHTRGTSAAGQRHDRHPSAKRGDPGTKHGRGTRNGHPSAKHGGPQRHNTTQEGGGREGRRAHTRTPRDTGRTSGRTQQKDNRPPRPCYSLRVTTTPPRKKTSVPANAPCPFRARGLQPIPRWRQWRRRGPERDQPPVLPPGCPETTGRGDDDRAQYRATVSTTGEPEGSLQGTITIVPAQARATSPAPTGRETQTTPLS